MLGHASAAMTLDVYADRFDDDPDAVAATLDRAKRVTDVCHEKGIESPEDSRSLVPTGAPDRNRTCDF